MMQSNKTNATRRTRVLALVPAAALGLVLLGLPGVNEAMASASHASMSVSSSNGSKVSTNSAIVQTAVSAAPDDEVAPVTGDRMPQFKGGESAMFKYLMENLTYPKDAEAAKKDGRVVVRFTITSDGAVRDVKVDTPIFPSLDAEAIRVVSGMDGMWEPGISNGQKVDMSYVIPVSFKLK